MGPVSTSIVIDAPREHITRFLADLANRPTIFGDAVSDYRLERIDSKGVGAGARFRLGKGNWVESRITEIDGDHLIRETGRSGRLGRIPTLTLWEFLEGSGPAGCEVTVTFMTEPSSPFDELSPRLTGRWRRHWSRSLANLKLVIEGGEFVDKVGVAGGQRLPG